MRTFVLALVLVLPLLPGRTANAQPPPDLAHEFQAGVDAYRLGHYDEARTHLEKARALDPKLPGPHRFLAAVARAQGRWEDCLGDARKALELNPQSQEVAETRKLHEGCRTSAGRSPLVGELGDSAAFAVTSNVDGATVKVGGLTYGGTPLAPRPITAGSLEIEVSKAGWKPAHTTVSVLAGIVTDVAVELEPDPNAVRSPDLELHPITKDSKGRLRLVKRCATQPDTNCPATDLTLLVDGAAVPITERIEIAPGRHVIEVHSPGGDPWRRRVRVSPGELTELYLTFVPTAEREHREHIGLGFLGGAGALVAAGFASALVSEHAAAEARDILRVETTRDPSKPASVDIVPIRTRADFNAAHDRATRYALVSDLSYAAALVTAGIGAYYLYTGARERTDVPPPFVLAPLRGGAMVAKEIAW